jgi:Ni,Fe-hydrogenase III large subunit/Ni,Fe-hydrogenase III component G
MRSKQIMLDELYHMLKNIFGRDIFGSIKKQYNELYLEVNPEKIVEISTYIYTELWYPLVSMFANDEKSLNGRYGVYYVFADREGGLLLILKTLVEPRKMEIRSISTQVHTAAQYEREIHDMFGIKPIGHPDARRLVLHGNWPDGVFPLRKEFDRKQKPSFEKKEIKFQKVMGTGVYEIPVGPVHAGIIEPGHFRFSVAGEPIINLEAQLYYVHKGIEKLCEGESIERCLYVSERISGDESFANSLTYCQAIEKIAGADVPIRAQCTRVIFAELERLTSHLGDLGGVCLDAAYGFATFQFRMMRGWAYAIAEELCGMRFLRSVNQLGGVRKDFISGKEAKIIEQLGKIKRELEDTRCIVEANSMFTDRIEHTGILAADIAADLNAVGPGGRASGMYFDVRKNYPYEVYQHFDFCIPEQFNGDIRSRFYTKLSECFESINLMVKVIEAMPNGESLRPIDSAPAYAFALGVTEAPRGENIHWIMTGENNTIFRYKIRTASFCNWPALCHAVKGNVVPDFPLINKSFNLSYAGNDL